MRDVTIKSYNRDLQIELTKMSDGMYYVAVREGWKLNGEGLYGPRRAVKKRFKELRKKYNI